MRLVILTSNKKGTASYCLPLICKCTNAKIVQVIYSKSKPVKFKKYFLRKLKKTFKIGFFGAINGVRIRSWFNGMGLKENLKTIDALCTELAIPYAETPALNHPETIALMKSADADLGLSLGNSYIPKKVYSQPRNGMINIHGEVLPEFQNAQSVIWQIYENNAETGYTIHKIDSTIDTGEILKIEKYPIVFKENLKITVKTMTDETLIRSAKGLIDVINDFDNYNHNASKQAKGKTYTTPDIWQFIRINKNFRRLKKVKI